MTPTDLKSARHLLGMSAEAFGQALGMTGRNIRRLEAGSIKIHASTAARVREMLRERELALRALAGER